MIHLVIAPKLLMQSLVLLILVESSQKEKSQLLHIYITFNILYCTLILIIRLSAKGTNEVMKRSTGFRLNFFYEDYWQTTDPDKANGRAV